MPPGGLPHGVSPASVISAQQTPVNNSSIKQQSGVNATSIMPSTASLTDGTATKRKKESAKAKKIREKEEQQRKELDAQQNQQTNFV